MSRIFHVTTLGILPLTNGDKINKSCFIFYDDHKDIINDIRVQLLMKTNNIEQWNMIDKIINKYIKDVI